MVFLKTARRWRFARSAILGGLLVCCARTSTAQETIENEVKAAFLYNFTKFVEWPAPPAPASEPFRLCVLADAAFVQVLDRTIAGEFIDGRHLERVEPQTIEDVHGCGILYIGHGHFDRGAQLLAAARDLPVLTVGDGPRFLAHGGAIGFVLENNRVRFDISLAAAQRSGLKVSSKLLRVARSVEGASR
jgi:hypothetical protein